jgi:hypothetical protein
VAGETLTSRNTQEAPRFGVLILHQQYLLSVVVPLKLGELSVYVPVGVFEQYDSPDTV